jgi:hypothetical protein
MVEIFQGAPAEVKREMNQWFAEHENIKLEWVLQDGSRDFLVAIIYRELENVPTQEEIDFGN